MGKSASIINEISIQYKRQQISERKITSSEVAAQIAREVYEQTGSNIDVKEFFYVLMLNRANKVTSYYKLSEGGICGTVADIRLLYRNVRLFLFPILTKTASITSQLVLI